MSPMLPRWYSDTDDMCYGIANLFACLSLTFVCSKVEQPTRDLIFKRRADMAEFSKRSIVFVCLRYIIIRSFKFYPFERHFSVKFLFVLRHYSNGQFSRAIRAHLSLRSRDH